MVAWLKIWNGLLGAFLDMDKYATRMVMVRSGPRSRLDFTALIAPVRDTAGLFAALVFRRTDRLFFSLRVCPHWWPRG